MMTHTIKVILSLALIATIILGLSLTSQKILHQTSLDMEQTLLQVENCISALDWKGAEMNLKSVRSKWSKIKKTWTVLIDHLEIDNIELAMIKVEKYISVRDNSSALAEASALTMYVRHIPEKEFLRPGNIF